MLKPNQVKGVLLASSHYTSKDTDFTPKGTLMVHFALTEWGTPELQKEYEDAKGAQFRDVQTGEHKGKALHFTSQFANEIKSGDLVEGGEIVFDWVKERLTKSETLVERAVKSSARKEEQAMAKVLSPETIAKMKYAAKLGLSVSI